MKKAFLLSIAIMLSLTLGFGTYAIAEKKHAPKPVWGAMVGGLNDIQGITAAMMVFDMKRAAKIAKELLSNPPKIGYLTISNALQWRLQYSRVIAEAGNVVGIIRVK